ncbi:MAG: peptide-methionine (S)-S-oxide reductase MsrA [Actinomycetaceae bacterium]|nr:peptide-methionine (S)-S-oxide reductase MsrA [Actinomycetaceae bacterium]
MPRSEDAYFAMGCFWGAERLMWSQPGVISTTVGYMGGTTKNPTYEQVCTGLTGHAETVHVVFDPDQTSFENLCKVFFENHDPTQLNRQGNDRGTQYRSAIFPHTPEQQESATQIAQSMNQLTQDKMGAPTVTIIDSGKHPFYPAEEYHQKYLQKNPLGYCNLRENGLTCPIPS